ncbi:MULTISPECIES: S9 family peptidase [Gammaproteobacteria]|uniref:alpha/beta hydrolase family protein n=1 Tax=Gammaproteobacteria TaxID=1236 RepID=UPI0014036862|nr:MULTISPECIES: prolyl oligopeptidase family serine peptidase [Gammaproteobacteria]
MAKTQHIVSLAVLLPLTFASWQGVTTLAHADEPSGEQRPLSVSDIMKFREIERQDWSDSGLVYAYDAVPDLGDPTGYVVRSTEQLSVSNQWEVERGTHPRVSANGAYVVFTQRPALLAREQAETDEEKKALVTNQVLVNVATGEQTVFENAESAEFTGSSQTLVVLQTQTLSDAEDDGKETPVLVFVDVNTGQQRSVQNVSQFVVADSGDRVAFQTKATDENPGEVWVRNTSNNSQLELIENTGKAKAAMSFDEAGDSIAILAAAPDSDKDEETRQLFVWNFGESEVSSVAYERDGWAISEHSRVSWLYDDTAIEVGFRPLTEESEDLPKPETLEDLYSLERILDDRRVQVWHGDDDRISTHQREGYRRSQRATAESLYWVDTQSWVHLSDDVELSTWIDDDYAAAMQSDATPYLREITWNGFFHDIYHVNVRTGEKQLVAEKVPSWQRGEMSPNGEYIAFLQNEKLNLFSAETSTSQEIGSGIDVSWVDEENDRPQGAYGYGFGGWLADSSAFFVYDRFDIWQFNAQGDYQNLTSGQGRETERSFRIVEKDEGFYGANEALFLRAYNEDTKGSGFYALNRGNQGLYELVAGEKTYELVHWENETNVIYFTEEDFRQFPDVQITDFGFAEPTRITEVNPQQSDFIWGDAELVTWESTVGEELEGILIKPDNYDPNRQYPVMVYYYEKFSQRLHQFNQMKVNHRPNFPFYLGQEYLVFLPDINFRVGAPGPSATESLVPAMEMLVEEGIADPDGLGLHGHSWSGYQTAFVVTETDIFDAAVAGAPVSNMTSAYSGIRWGSGLARQFQYEQGQSRLGVNMYEDIDPYIENSPVFFADRINTPMLIQFGDEDGAVPWEQGIEYYLALRRLDKPVVMLQYEGEPHHLQQYANKVDYTLKMLEFFDYHLKGEGSPSWWLEGVEYQAYD